ncbi:ABC transporter ATP-binding protein [Haloimpatiens sp. FM7315]|uniref:ABC transporter ATP-binding protein n=1 Tax=Haloimpatiens sp. FM7315 TaxID=3298609 RepID=UPI0035A29A6D
MLKLVKYLKPFIGSVIIIIALLFVQAMCDLALPDYMSNIVNIGIQQNGIDNAVPNVIRKSELDKIMYFVSENDKKLIEGSYKVLDKENLSEKEYKDYIAKYPYLEKAPIYKLNINDKNSISKLNDTLGKSIAILKIAEEKGITDKILTTPKSKIDSFKGNLEEKVNTLPDNMITQSYAMYIKGEYKQIGINTDKVQSNYILLSGLKMLLLALLSVITTVIVGLLAAKVAAGLGKNLRKNIFKKVTSFSSAEFDKFSTASLITRSTNDIQQIQTLMVMLLRVVFYAPILGVGGILKVISTDTSMAWIIAVAVMSILTLVIVLFGVAIPKFKSVQKLVDRLNLITRESLSGILVIRAFNTEKFEEKKFKKANMDLTKTNLFISRIMTMMMPMMMLVMNLITVLIVWVGAHRIDGGTMQVGNMMAFLQYTMQIIMAFLMISMVSLILPRASVSAQRVYEVLNTKNSINDSEDNFKISSLDVTEKGTIEFKNVSFKYNGAEDNALSNISFKAKPGETTAFIGSTGSGKSTLINLIPRFYDVTEGEILVDGVNVKDLLQNKLREKIGYVPQKGMLFSGTIDSNIKYGNKNASKEEVIEAANIAQASEFINLKPEGFEAKISQGGNNVSGGQKQRLSIARALIKKPEIFIFDDSFSALDFKTDAKLRKAINKTITKSTILIVAQRISSIMNANKIIVLDDGKIVGIGSHKELMINCDVYKQIALSQLSKEELHHE